MGLSSVKRESASHCEMRPLWKPSALMLGALFAGIAVTACKREDRITIPICPPGDMLVGNPPPRGSEVYCKKVIAGKALKDGPFVVYAAGGGKLIEGNYRDGVQEGTWTTWYENGQRSATDHFHQGLQDGLHTSWYANGQKAIEGNYRAGKREGIWTQWVPSGLTSRQQTYQDDKVVK
jgi:MORN repeat variant